MATEDLWGDLPAVDEVRLPITILKEQATVLSEKTNKILEGKVMSFDTKKKNSLGYIFYVVAPALGNYQYTLLWIRHSTVFVYPTDVFYDEDDITLVREATDQDQFVKILGELLSSSRVRKVIASLLAQSASAD